VPAVLPRIGWRHVAFALLALTVVRIVPIALSLLGTETSWRDRLVLGWLGPRGFTARPIGAWYGGRALENQSGNRGTS
jgi:NhaP-type Na+/H+ or K+/H+ antiporter